MPLKIEKVIFGLIPCYVVYPIRETGKTVIFYHGWSSKGELQVNRAAFLAVHGYTVFIPDAVNHGERHALSDYYTSEGYDIFWKTIFSNVEEFPFYMKGFFLVDMKSLFLWDILWEACLYWELPRRIPLICGGLFLLTVPVTGNYLIYSCRRVLGFLLGEIGHFMKNWKREIL